MKRFFCLAFLLYVTLSGIFAQSAAQIAAPGSAVIRELTGEVELKPEGASGFVPARQGDEVAQNTVVSTGFKSTAIIAAGSSLITVRPLTRLSLAEIQTTSGTENINMNLRNGRVKVDVNPPAGTKTNFTVQSPNATASVRGTSFEFDTRRIGVAEGKVSFRGTRGKGMLVSAGFKSYVGNEGNVIDPEVVKKLSLEPPPPVGSDFYGKAPLPPNEYISIDIQYPVKR